MIRVLKKADIERVVDIWLDTNLTVSYTHLTLPTT